MPDLGYFHPQIVHFVIALLFVGVACRVISLLPLGSLAAKLKFTGPMAATLIILGTLASVAAAKSGDDAHGPAERVPGARDAVVEHEEHGERTRNIFLVVALLEIGALAIAAKPAAKWVRIGSAVVGLGGLASLFEAAEHGGELVYAYAGGVGIRSGDSTDVTRLLVAGLYHSIQRARTEGRPADAARLVDELARQAPDNGAVLLLAIESRIRDRGDAAGALVALDSFDPGDNARLLVQKALLTAQALEATGRPDSAIRYLESLRESLPDSRPLADALERLRGGGAAQPPR